MKINLQPKRELKELKCVGRGAVFMFPKGYEGRVYMRTGGLRVPERDGIPIVDFVNGEAWFCDPDAKVYVVAAELIVKEV